MTNRLIWLIIILIFILLWIWYYFLIEKEEIKNKIISKNNIEVKKETIKKTTLIKVEKKQDNNSLFALSDETKQELINKKNLKIKQNIWNILKINNLDKINIQKIIWDENLFLVNFDKINYIYNKKRLNLEKINLNIPIIYAKKINSIIHFITEKWTFLYKNDKIEYFPIFSDFIIKNWNYIWIIKNSDKSIKKNFNFQNISWDLIILYNPKKAIKQILYKPNFEIKKILLENNNIIIESNNWEKYILDY